MKSNLVLKEYWDDEGFDYDGGGDYFFTRKEWKEFDSEDSLLKYLQDNICDEEEGKPLMLKSIKDYMEYGFEVYKRVYA